MAKVSVVIPTRDRDKLIDVTIKSLLEQTEQDFEIIVVDDHSAIHDKTKDVIDSFSDKRIKYFKLDDQNGIGISAARNFGNMMAQSEYIAVMDSDDFCYPYRIEESLHKMKEGFDVVYGEIDHWWPETGLVKKRDNEYHSREFDIEIYKKLNFIPHGTTLHKRQHLLSFPYNSFFRKSEDYDLLSRLAVAGYKFGFINKSLIKYRKHPQSIMHNNEDNFDYAEVVRRNRGWL